MLSTGRAVLRTTVIGRHSPVRAVSPRLASSSASAAAFGLKDPSLVKFQGLIGGQWTDGNGGGTISVQSPFFVPHPLRALTSRARADPATAETLGAVPEMGLDETRAAIDAAATAFKTWSRTTAKERHDILMKMYYLMQENADDLARIIVSRVL
jgi:succinate-semialdehyde dehydrogenase/glutarate-semialdehyde dehydrogenase